MPPPPPQSQIPNAATPSFALPLTTGQRVVAALAHLFAIIPIWGLVANFWIWHTRREEHPELRFQTLQAFFLQAIGLLITVVYAVAQLFFQLLGVLNPGLSATLCAINTWVWEATIITLALAALWGAWSVRWPTPAPSPTRSTRSSTPSAPPASGPSPPTPRAGPAGCRGSSTSSSRPPEGAETGLPRADSGRSPPVR